MLNSEPTATLSNQDFCYWLQGYFEISQEATLNAHQIALILNYLDKISEPLGPMTAWLKKVCIYCQEQECRPATLAHFLPLIQNYLNQVFHHVIDNSYVTDKNPQDLQDIHDGVTHD